MEAKPRRWRVVGLAAAVVVVSVLAVGLLVRGDDDGGQPQGFVTSDTYLVPGQAMEPTFSPGDRVHAQEIAGDEVGRGDIVLVNVPSSDGHDPLLTIKRVVAVAGDEISTTPDGELLINGEVADEPYLAPGTVTASLESQVVPDAHVFVMGDNRLNSLDSRITGPVPHSDVVALVVSTSKPG